MTYPANMTADATHEIARPRSPSLDAVLGHAFEALDHGFVRVIDYMGDDAAVCQAARVSYGAGTKSVSDDRGLIRYLMKHWHSTPFEMCEIKLHVKLPIFVARQWIRHRTANVNEYSARYSIMDREFYIPAAENLAVQSSDNKQGRSTVLGADDAETVRQILMRDANLAYDHYEAMSDPDGIGLARELARMNLPTNIYTQWYWKVDLHNLLHFLRLRADPHAQWEIRQYANVICELVRSWVPHSFEAFEDYRQHAVTFSRQEMGVLKGFVSGLPQGIHSGLRNHLQRHNLSKREMADFLKKFES